MAALVSSQNTSQQQQAQAQQPQTPHHLIEIHAEAGALLPTALGLKMRTPHKQQQQQSNHNSNSLLKQQLRAGLKDIDSNAGNTNNHTNNPGTIASNSATSTLESPLPHDTSCSALQSLAIVAERQAPNAIQPPSANNLHHQFLLHMAANPMLKSSSEFFQQQQLQQQQMHEDERATPPNLELLLEQNDKSEPELTLADESAGLDYKSSENSANDSINRGDGNVPHSNSNAGHTSRPIQRRRIRRKAQSTLDDQAEHLTEMSVRGLDLFRYASITEGVYQCTECAKENVQKTFKNKYSFQRHAFLYHEGKHRKVFPCPVCGKEFSRPDKMKNHMKMTHESFVAKDMANFNPLNYLITAAAAGEIHSSFFPQQQQQPTLLSECMPEELTTAATVARGDEDMCLNLAQDDCAPPSSPLIPIQTEAEALLKLQNDICIKNEIVISPSPSPPPLSAVGVKSQVTSTQRLEEVK